MSITKPSGNLLKHSHRFSGYCGDVPYLYYKSGEPYVDGIERGHVNLYSKCDICGEEVLVAKMHTDRNGKLYQTALDKKKIADISPKKTM